MKWQTSNSNAETVAACEEVTLLNLDTLLEAKMETKFYVNCGNSLTLNFLRKMNKRTDIEFCDGPSAPYLKNNQGFVVDTEVNIARILCRTNPEANKLYETYRSSSEISAMDALLFQIAHMNPENAKSVLKDIENIMASNSQRFLAKDNRMSLADLMLHEAILAMELNLATFPNLTTWENEMMNTVHEKPASEVPEAESTDKASPEPDIAVTRSEEGVEPSDSQKQEPEKTNNGTQPSAEETSSEDKKKKTLKSIRERFSKVFSKPQKA